ncbi:hypothetical protein evm_003909 [Chilo suppressalis]|nr:hypothetical protein evm_003909 [Chilo suppressalis]
MKNSALILLCAFALATTTSTDVNSNGCPQDWNIEKLLPHPKCNKFYQCWDGKLIPLTCPSKLYFSVQQNRCEWAEKVDCVDKDIPDDNSDGDDDNVGGGNCDPSLAPKICAVEGSDDVLVANENCNKFYICANGKPFAQKCPDNLLFNPSTDRCDWPKNVDCGDRVIPDDESREDNESSNEDDSDNVCDNGEAAGGDNDDPSSAPEICSAEGSNDVLVAHENCNQFYICANGKPVPRSCPSNLLFNPRTDRCDWSKCVDCGSRVIPDDNCNGDGNNSNGDDNSNENEGDESGENSGDDDVCYNGEVVGGGNDNPSLAAKICSAGDSNDVLVAHENCNQFYICANGKPVPQSCPGNLVFNPSTDRCDWSKCVDCGDRAVPGDENEGTDNNNECDKSSSGAGNDDSSLAAKICSAEDSNDVLVAHENCNQFYICANGKPVPQSCPGNLLFNPSTDRCDWPKCVDCGSRVIPDDDCNDDDNNSNGDDNSNENGDDENGENGDDNDSNSCDNGEVAGSGNDDPSLAANICSAEDSNDVLVAHENCNQFYICANGKPVPQSCPGNLVFNPSTDRCDWSKCVDCGDRAVPGDENEGTDNNNECDKSSSGAGNDDISLAAKICSAEDSNDVLVAHENCNQFYICANGKPVPQSCPSNLLFNPRTDRCDWSKCVDCGDRAIPADENEETDNNNECAMPVNRAANNDPRQASTICLTENSEGVLVAHENCNQFYICNHSKPVVVDCPPSLLFNPYSDKCDWSHCVECGQRLKPNNPSYGTFNKHLQARQAFRRFFQ